ncbi:DUF2975 domain-containing protein [Microvirga rosea]|uniref:DUF2975 domain-containing protein n=1 Tax=Microvirga rosea TaxID=2715425 RepID=UPI001D0A6F18|nr:DUF2975 domain-containing protein [Microvirga rosea]MCB8821265.1 DUF2975 domain-containing protein [Microvirga rosea]
MALPVSFPSGRLVQFSRSMSLVTMAGLVGIVFANVLLILIPEWTRDLLLARVGQIDQPLVVSRTTGLLGGLVMAVPACVLMFGLWQVRCLFDSIAQGEVFSLKSADRLQAFAITVFAQALLGPLSVIGLSLVFSLANPPGQRFVAVTLSAQDYMAIVIGGVLWAVTYAMREATRLAEENASFI